MTLLKEITVVAMYNTNPEVGAGFFAFPRVVRVVAAQPPVS